MSSYALLSLLLFYPAAILALPEVFLRLWPKMRPPTPNLANAKTEEERAALTDLGVWLPLFTYAILLVGTLLWLKLFPTNLNQSVFFKGGWLSNILVGAYLGTAWAGVSVWLLSLGAATGRMRREIPGLMAPLKSQSAVWFFGALAEEAWRVVAIVALLRTGNSTLVSIVAVSVAFGVAYSGLGLQRVAIATIDGFFFGFLYLWRGSLLAPVLAHLAIQAVYLWGVGQLSHYKKSRKTWRIPGTKCPVCQTSLGLLEIKINEVFDCPSCKESLSVSDTYQNLMRFAGASVLVFVHFCSTFLSMIWLPFNVGICVFLGYPATLGIYTSGFLLYRKAFVRLFPPRLQQGTPYFIRLNLGSRRELKGNRTETDESVGIPPRTPE